MPFPYWRLLPQSGLLWLGLLCGCASPLPPPKPLRITGRVVDRHTGLPLAGATVHVYAQSGSGLAAGGYQAAEETWLSDQQGNFSFEAPVVKGVHYVLRASAPPGYYTLWSEAPAVGQDQPNAALRLPVQAPAYVRIRLRDDPPHTPARITVYGYASNVDEFKNSDTLTYLRTLDAGEKRRINWEILNEKGEIKTAGQDLLLSPLDTQNVIIHF
ncbi:carboxypeptidase-like regulatory domain-containing protein [Hymenobacter lucidus]|uniref:Carboxypeptidase-like regulatory domain-containing protein n=1 Tax=Hymenobacter lucidus TaxID=2880930 RepID=A0ABS8ALI1_9BACT|nr:carboxypeptidase-like regulatory domain-containing protein [Hymenobacter lucidus]MCB2406503.1 carboxypeptidase-like regulatory domain-containing protein [Hymenobacter lucidus]